MLGPEDVYRLDINSRWLGIPTEFLMENAGKDVAEVVLGLYPKSMNVVCICSRTNNGGDGLVAARHLSARKNVTVVFVGRPELIRTEETRTNWEIINGLFFVEKVFVKTEENLKKLEKALSDADVVIDAIFGIGIRGTPRGLEAKVIRKINELKQKNGFKVVSIDVPSGFDCFRGEPTDIMVDSDVIVTFHDTKKGLDKLGKKVIVRDIGIPKDAELFVGPGDMLKFLKERDPWSHKGNFGRILIVGGSDRYTGAPALSALSALRTGADLAIIFAPSKISQTLRSFSPNLIVWEYEGDVFNEKAVPILVELVKNNKFDVLIIGPGIGSAKETIDAVHMALRELSGQIPIIIDADAFKSLSKYGIPRGDIIITPHAGEFKLIFGCTPSSDIKERGNLVREYAKKHGITILLKGHIDVISNGTHVKFNRTGNPGMTVGGTGDVLTGIVAAIRSVNNDSFRSASIGAFLCGFAGDLAYKNYGYELVATDVVNSIPEALKYLREFVK
ncbi:MAG: NAD(P)H-hydrate dehydratase [Candidatus Njordarchaeota archaeon]